MVKYLVLFFLSMLCFGQNFTKDQILNNNFIINPTTSPVDLTASQVETIIDLFEDINQTHLLEKAYDKFTGGLVHETHYQEQAKYNKKDVSLNQFLQKVIKSCRGEGNTAGYLERTSSKKYQEVIYSQDFLYDLHEFQNDYKVVVEKRGYLYSVHQLKLPLICISGVNLYKVAIQLTHELVHFIGLPDFNQSYLGYHPNFSDYTNYVFYQTGHEVDAYNYSEDISYFLKTKYDLTSEDVNTHFNKATHWDMNCSELNVAGVNYFKENMSYNEKQVSRIIDDYDSYIRVFDHEISLYKKTIEDLDEINTLLSKAQTYGALLADGSASFIFGWLDKKTKVTSQNDNKVRKVNIKIMKKNDAQLNKLKMELDFQKRYIEMRKNNYLKIYDEIIEKSTK